MKNRTLTKIISGLIATVALTIGVSATAAEAASDDSAKKISQYRDTGWT